jgi:hypothetical protein
MVALTCNPSTQEAEAGGVRGVRVQGQPGLHRDSCLKKKREWKEGRKEGREDGEKEGRKGEREGGREGGSYQDYTKKKIKLVPD